MLKPKIIKQGILAILTAQAINATPALAGQFHLSSGFSGAANLFQQTLEARSSEIFFMNIDNLLQNMLQDNKRSSRKIRFITSQLNDLNTYIQSTCREIALFEISSDIELAALDAEFEKNSRVIKAPDFLNVLAEYGLQRINSGQNMEKLKADFVKKRIHLYSIRIPRPDVDIDQIRAGLNKTDKLLGFEKINLLAQRLRFGGLAAFIGLSKSAAKLKPSARQSR
ncbi:hypothetical protein [Maridesulfovibrio sp.]|uniref:hypothetical protein n=1 Tax=Maridesulfovibrio sp. TaxID=2795000 RepID=UPI0039EDF949